MTTYGYTMQPCVVHQNGKRIIDAGGIVHARTTTPEFSCAPVTWSKLWGVTRNPWNLAYSPGGSSGGSAAALAAGSTTLATGSDIGGSIRIPSSFSGVTGFKPPYGRVPEELRRGPGGRREHRCPVLSVPSGRARNGVPTGLSVVGKTYDDVTAFRVAAAHEERYPWYTDPSRRPAIG